MPIRRINVYSITTVAITFYQCVVNSWGEEFGSLLSPCGTELASLFGLDQETSQGNESFQYTAPKQPRKSSNQAPSNQKPAPQPGAPAVLFVTAVQAFKYINGQYMKQGKLGAAVLGNHTTKEYKLLLYLSQQKQVTSAKIHVGFAFTVQQNNYCTFYDDQRQNWSLMFESEKSASDFCKEVCLAKVNSAVTVDVVVLQDLSLGEGQSVENGDSVEVVYTGWLLENHTCGQMFDSNQNKDKLLRLKIGAGKVIRGWEEGMLGMKKAGRRLIVIPPDLAYGSKGVPNRVPANSTLIFEAELRRVKFSKDSGSDRASAGSRDSAAPSPALSIENLVPEPSAQAPSSGSGRPGEPPLRTKSNSLSEQLANPDATKAKLISRMAKMGQPMLPFLTGAASQPESSDSELEVSILSLHPHPHAPSTSALLPVMSTVTAQPGLPTSSHAFQVSFDDLMIIMLDAMVPNDTPLCAAVVSQGSGDVTSFLMTEARQHNTEIRLAVGKVGDKVDQLASKIDDLQRQGGLSTGLSSVSMETSMILHNIQRIVQENECLKKEVFEKSSRIEEQNRKIGDLINQNQRYMEQSHLMLEQRNDSLKSSSEQNQARLLQAEQDKVRLTEDLASAAARVSQLQLEASAHQQKAAELQGKLSTALQDGESRCQRVAALEAQLEELKEEAERVQTQHRSEKQRRKETELKVNTMEEELQDLKTDKESLERALSERKKKWQVERQRRDEEVEELRKSSQQELDNLRAQLRKARTSSDNAASEQLSQLQAELEQEWKGKCSQMLASAKEQHSREVAELAEQREALQDKLTQLQEKACMGWEGLQPYRLHCIYLCHVIPFKYTALEQQGATVRQKLQRRVAELESKLEEQEDSGDTAAEVKRVMNGVFHSLRGEFDLTESYTGQAVLGVIVSTIKNVTLQLLSAKGGAATRPITKEEETAEEEEKEEVENVKQQEEEPHQNVHINGETEVRKEEEEEHVADSDSHQVRETREDQEEAAEETVCESNTTTQAEHSESTDIHHIHPVSTTELESEELTITAAAECEVQEEEGQRPAPESSAEDKDTSKSLDPDERSPDDGQGAVSETTAAVTSEACVDSVEDDGEDVGEKNAASHKAFGPPSNPPPPPSALQDTSGENSLILWLGLSQSKKPHRPPYRLGSCVHFSYTLYG
uniref:peptidylprolyl isomerase n=1 Tax=Neolamprologus brichardi TaxID=32507 RepID=A0A3Q4GW51_NEOBR